MSAIGPGDWVECVDAGQSPFATLAGPLRHGALYCVEATPYLIYRGQRVPGLVLVGVRSDSPYGSFWAERFRPLYRPQEHAFDYLLENLPAEMEEA